MKIERKGVWSSGRVNAASQDVDSEINSQMLFNLRNLEIKPAITHIHDLVHELVVRNVVLGPSSLSHAGAAGIHRMM